MFGLIAAWTRTGGRIVSAGAPTAPVWFWANAIRALLPMMEQLGVATRAEVDIETLEHRVTTELAANDAVMFAPPMTAAGARIPDRPPVGAGQPAAGGPSLTQLLPRPRRTEQLLTVSGGWRRGQACPWHSTVTGQRG
jgi:hypothetical protein